MSVYDVPLYTLSRLVEVSYQSIPATVVKPGKTGAAELLLLDKIAPSTLLISVLVSGKV